jgi:hypothetical protein
MTNKEGTLCLLKATQCYNSKFFNIGKNRTLHHIWVIAPPPPINLIIFLTYIPLKEVEIGKIKK